MSDFRQTVKKIMPTRVFSFFQPAYHYALAYIGAVKYRHPSRDITIIGVTGTKGKSTTTEILAQILRGAGYKTASLSTIQFTYGEEKERNMFKMTMPGRYFTQQFLRRAVDAGCTHAVVEMTSEGAKQYRHKFIDVDALLFTNLTPEHIESHGSFTNYKSAKLRLAEAVATSPKRPRTLVANVDDEHGQDFLNYEVEHILPYRLNNLTLHSLQKDSVTMVIDNVTIRVPIVGVFNVYNTLAAITYARSIGISLESIRESLAKLPPVAGRVEQFHSPTGSDKKITVVVDYAHTPDSLTQLYQAFADKYKIGILGNTGGGRDTWKRPEMGAIAEEYCDQVILTNEDPYDENPQTIVEQMKNGMSAEASVEIIMDRKAAIKHAIDICPEGGYVLISGKGTDPYIMGPNGTRREWSDSQIVRELLTELIQAND
jgi:UDP-N-acetylmuramoyl-L-alanyl-D-glutamate--2,6-diaminopimelate ligase